MHLVLPTSQWQHAPSALQLFFLKNLKLTRLVEKGQEIPSLCISLHNVWYDQLFKIVVVHSLLQLMHNSTRCVHTLCIFKKNLKDTLIFKFSRIPSNPEYFTHLINSCIFEQHNVDVIALACCVDSAAALILRSALIAVFQISNATGVILLHDKGSLHVTLSF